MTASPPDRGDLNLPLLSISRANSAELPGGHHSGARGEDGGDQYRDHDPGHYPEHDDRRNDRHGDGSPRHQGPHADTWTPNGSPRSTQVRWGDSQRTLAQQCTVVNPS